MKVGEMIIYCTAVYNRQWWRATVSIFQLFFFGKGTIVGIEGDNDDESPKVEMYNCTTCGLINQVTNLSKVLLYSWIGNSSISAGFYKIIMYFNISRNIAIFVFETAVCLLFALSFSKCPKYSQV